MKAILDSQGRIKLPGDVQKLLGIKPGDEVLLEARADQCVIRPDKNSSSLQWEGNVLVHQGMTHQTPEAVLAELRNERLDRFGEGLAP